jgi:hypothetical protein
VRHAVEHYNNLTNYKLMAENTDEEHIDNPTNTQSKTPSDEIIPINDTETISRIVYKGKLLFTARALIAIAFLIFIGTMVADKTNVVLKSYGALFCISFVVIFIIAITAFQFYYFIIDGDKLIVKNQVLFWTKTVYELNHVKEIELVDSLPAGSSNSISLRITDHKLKSKLYRAAGLRYKTWKLLLEHLKDRKVNVNDSGTQFDEYR